MRYLYKIWTSHTQIARRIVSPAVSMAPPPSVQSSCETHTERNGVDGKYANINWDDLSYSITPADYMYVMKCMEGEEFCEGKVVPYQNIEISPASGILNYGHGLFEGMKAYRREDGRVLLFRPQENALRMKMGAERMCLPSPSVQQFVDAVKQTVLANMPWVPPSGKGSLYIRPLLMGTGEQLGVGFAPECMFLIYCSPVGNYYKEGRKAANLVVEEKIPRAVCGGTGGIKSVTNYAPTYKALLEARAKGYSDIVFLDAAQAKYIEEVSTSNVFIVKDDVISTPPAHGTILRGVTRKSIIDIALDLGYQVQERVISVKELMNADEVFCTGTAVVVNPVGSITYQGKRVTYRTGEDAVSEKLHAALTGIQNGVIEDKWGWTLQIN